MILDLQVLIKSVEVDFKSFYLLFKGFDIDLIMNDGIYVQKIYI